MDEFLALLAALQNPPEEGNPETIYDDLTAHYTDAVGSRDTQIGESAAANESLVAENAALTAEINRIKVEIFDKIMAGGDPISTDSDGSDNDEDEDYSDEGIDSLFEDEKED